jgi:4-amino-4-deoxy-L-arabinose transferase-like glycosyltransferase
MLVLLCLALYLPGITTIPPIDRDEARFAQASRQMLESHDFVRIRFHEEARNKKPIGIYWLQAAAAAALAPSGTNPIWPYRIPSVLGATAAVLLIFALGKTLFDARTALLAAAFMAVSLVLMVEAHQATTDAFLLATVVASQGALGRLYQQTRGGGKTTLGTALAFWLAQGVGILVKGPVVPLIGALTIAGLVAADRSARFLKGLHFRFGVPLAAVIVLPWAIAIYLATDGAFYLDALRVDILPKVVSGQESHGFPPGTYLLIMFLTFWPGSLFAGLGFFRGWKLRSMTGERFCLAWLIPSWLVFELIPTKLPHYVMPMYPALALLAARTVVAYDRDPFPEGQSWLARAGFVVWSLVSLGLGAAIVAVPWLFNHRLAALNLFPAIAAVFIATIPVWYAFKGRFMKAAVAAIVISVLILIPTFREILPNVNALWLSRSAAQAVDRHDKFSAGSPRIVAAAGYDEPSLVFLLGTKTKFVSAEQAASYLGSHPDGLALISEEVKDPFLRAMSDLNLPARFLESVRGFNYSNGRWVTLALYTAASVPPEKQLATKKENP